LLNARLSQLNNHLVDLGIYVLIKKSADGHDQLEEWLPHGFGKEIDQLVNCQAMGLAFEHFLGPGVVHVYRN